MGTPRNIVHVSAADIAAGRVNHITSSDQSNLDNLEAIIEDLITNPKVTGPSTSVVSDFALFNSTDGKMIKDGGRKGTAASLDVGTTSGTVAAGDDSRITHAVQDTLTNSHIWIGDSSNSPVAVAVSNDVTISNTGVATIANGAVTNSKMASVPAYTLKGNSGATSGAMQDLTVSQVNTLLGDTGDSRWAKINRKGFVDNTQTTISFNPTTYTFTIADNGAGWQYMFNGSVVNITGNKSVTLTGTPPAAGTYYFYISDTSGTITASTVQWELGSDDQVFVAYLLWDDSLTPKYLLGEERHTVLWDSQAHREAHRVFGTKLDTDGGVSEYAIAPLNPTDASNCFSVGSSKMWDEDLELTLSPLSLPSGGGTDYTCVYATASGNFVWEESGVPFMAAPSGYIYYNSSGNLTQADKDQYVNWYLIFTNLYGKPRFSMLPGSGAYDTLTEAKSEANSNFLSTQWPILECIIMYRFTFQTSGGYINKGKCRIAATAGRVGLNLRTITELIGVTTFNGRTGFVFPLSGDYTPGQVGFTDPSTFVAVDHQKAVVAQFSGYPKISTGLTGQWTLANTLSDIVAGRDLTNHGMTFVSDSTFPLGTRYVARFDGSSYAVFSDVGMATEASPRSIVAWFKLDPSAPSSPMRIFGYGTPTALADFAIGVDNYDAAFATTSGDVVSSVAVNDGEWHCAVVTYASNVVTLYIDNTSAATSTVTLNTALDGGCIGAREYTFDQFFTGWVSDCRKYDHVLSSFERLAIQGGDVGSNSAYSLSSSPLGTAAFITAPDGDSSELLANDGNFGFTNVDVGDGLVLTSATVSGVTTSTLSLSATVNGYSLYSNPVLNYSDVGAVPTSRTVNGHSLATNLSLVASDVAAVPLTRTINNKQLNTNVNLTASDIGLGNVTNDAQLKMSQLGTANGVAPLGADTKIPSTYLPDLTYSTTYVVTGQAEMLALSANVGDIAVRTDVGNSYVLAGEPPSVSGNWVQLQSSAPVSSVNGYTGNVSLTKSDVGLGSVPNVDATDASHITFGNLESGRLPLSGNWSLQGPLTFTSSVTGAVPFTVVASPSLSANMLEVYKNGDLHDYIDYDGKLVLGAQNGAVIYAESLLTVLANTNTFNQINMQNLSSGSLASSDFVATADNGTNTTNFVDLGINSSGYTGGGSVPNPGAPGDSYLYASNKSIWIGLAENSTNNKINFFVAGDFTAKVFIDNNGKLNIPAGASNNFVLTSNSVGACSWTALAAIARSGSYTDLSDKPTIPAAQVNSDWNSSSGLSQILNKPTLATVATTGVYSDLTGKPTLATVATTGVYSDLTGKPTLATVAGTGSYNDLTDKPSIPAAQVNSDWNSTTGVSQILNKPTLATIATTGAFTDLVSHPTTLTGYGITDAVPSTTTVNGYALSSNVTITTTDLGAVPTSRTINGHNLSSDVTITAANVGLGSVANALQLVAANNLSDLTSVSTARTNLGLGSAALLTAGTSANNAVQLDSSAKLPAVDGSALTNVNSVATVLTVTYAGHGFTNASDVNKAIALDSTGKPILAIASSLTNAQFIGILTSVVSTSVFKVVAFGDYSWTSHGFALGSTLFLSGTSAGSLTTSGTFKKIAVVQDVNTLIIQPGDTPFGSATTPTVAFGTGAGTGGTGSVTGSNVSFQLSVTVGSSAGRGVTLATVTFSEVLPMATPRCVISPANVNAAVLNGTTNVWANSTSSTVVFTTGTGTALSNGTTYVWNCHIM